MNIVSSSGLPRRAFLRGVGALVGLPLLEGLLPGARLLAGAPARTAGGFPLRMAFVYIPNGANMADWTPKKGGEDFELPYILEPLKGLRGELQVVSGLADDKARPNGDGPGDHARASASFLTGCQARKTAGADIHVGVSVDQLAASHAGSQTRLPSLELGCDKARLSGDCDSGYACAYQFNISWKTATTPLPPETDPRQVFERLFAPPDPHETAAGRALRHEQEKSILDFVREDARALRAKLGRNDQQKLEEYLTAVRELERRVEQAEDSAASRPDAQAPEGIPAEFPAHLRLMYDMLALAFQSDATRVATMITAFDGSNRAYPFLGVSEGHHDLSHHCNDEAKKQKIARINRFHVEEFGRFLEKLRGLREGDGSVLDNSMIVYGGAIGDGNAHNHDNLPILLAGRGGGAFHPGRHLQLPRETPMTNLYLAMLERFGVKADRIGDSTGRLDSV